MNSELICHQPARSVWITICQNFPSLITKPNVNDGRFSVNATSGRRVYTLPVICQSHNLFSPRLHLFYRIHVFSCCLQQGVTCTPSSSIFSSFFSFGISPLPSIPLAFPSLSLTRPQRIPHTARVSPKSCQDMFCCQRDAEWERIRYWPWCVPDKKQAN